MKVAVFYYTQSGQALDVAKSICSPIEDSNDNIVIYKEIQPMEKYPFPWSKNEFFDVFPETRLGIPPSGINPVNFSDIEDADMVIIVGQSWFLSPSLPLQSFFTDYAVKNYMKGRQVVFVNSCRNMWLMTSYKVKKFLADCGAFLKGHIVMQDEGNNLIGVLTVIRWLIYGKKEKSGILPAAGVSDKDVAEASRFGKIIMDSVNEGSIDTLQTRLLQAGAIHYRPSVLYLEKVGHRIFGLWAKIIRRKGGFKDPRRLFRVNLFYIYLLAVLFLVSPFATCFFYLTYPLHHVARNQVKDCGV